MRRFLVALTALAATVGVTAPAHAITFGQFDGNRHPQVGAMVADWNTPGVPELFCTGTLIDEDTFLTASHCTDALESLGIAPDEIFVTFDPTFDAQSPLLPGTYHTHPDFGFSGPGGRSDPHDIAVVELDAPVTGITPARLPTLNQLNRMALKRQRFTAVGYGAVRMDKRKGPQALEDNTQRNFVTQGFLSLTKSWLNLSMNPSTGSGGTCFGDSGGPHFLGSSDLVVSITITGDSVCRATDVTYRLDTASARAFLDDFVDLP
jgi:hypothetical protein